MPQWRHCHLSLLPFFGTVSPSPVWDKPKASQVVVVEGGPPQDTPWKERRRLHCLVGFLGRNLDVSAGGHANGDDLKEFGCRDDVRELGAEIKTKGQDAHFVFLANETSCQ